MAIGDKKEPIRRNRKLTKEKARLLRSFYESGKVSMRELAEEFGVSISCVNQVLKNQTFKTDENKIVLTSKRFLIIER